MTMIGADPAAPTVTSGPQVALSSPAANLSAGGDTALTFVSRIAHLWIQNNSATDCQIEFDTAATAGSLKVAVGATLFLDLPCLVLHVYSAAATPVNGSAGGNLVVRGYSW